MSEFQKKKLVPMRIPRITAVIKAPLAPSSTLKRILGGTAGAALRRFAFIKNEHPEANGPAVTPGRAHCLTS